MKVTVERNGVLAPELDWASQRQGGTGTASRRLILLVVFGLAFAVPAAFGQVVFVTQAGGTSVAFGTSASLGGGIQGVTTDLVSTFTVSILGVPPGHRLALSVTDQTGPDRIRSR